MNIEVMEEMRELQARLETMEIDRRRDPEVRDVSKTEDEEQREEVSPMKEKPELRYFKLILGENSRPKPELSTYDGSLIIEYLIEWISQLDKYFEYDEIEEDKRVRLVVTIFKVHSSL